MPRFKYPNDKARGLAEQALKYIENQRRYELWLQWLEAHGVTEND